ncbi:MAG: type II secretion system F family protein [Erysipelotrichaceae bacterium]
MGKVLLVGILVYFRAEDYMPLYQYNAKDINAKKHKGKREARDEQQLVALLREDGLYLTQFEEIIQDNENGYRFKLNDLSEFSRQIGTMLGSGVSLIKALKIIIDRTQKVKQKEIYEGVYRKLSQGEALSDALLSQGKAFPKLMVNMFKAGESSGQLEKTAMKLSNQYEKDYKLNNKMKTAAMYPLVLIVVTIIVLLIIFVGVLPSFFDLFEQVELPLVTRILIFISNAITSYWYFVLLFFVLLVSFIIYLVKKPRIKIKIDKKKVTIWKVGKLFTTLYTARFARTLCSLYTSGIPIVQSLQVVRDTLNNSYIESQFPELINKVKRGEPLSSSLADIKGFDIKLSSMVYVGEESGKLETMLESLADDFDYEAQEASTRLVTILEPVLIVIMAVIIGFVMIAVMLPIYSLYKNVGSM